MDVNPREVEGSIAASMDRYFDWYWEHLSGDERALLSQIAANTATDLGGTAPRARKSLSGHATQLWPHYPRRRGVSSLGDAFSRLGAQQVSLRVYRSALVGFTREIGINQRDGNTGDTTYG